MLTHMTKCQVACRKVLQTYVHIHLKFTSDQPYISTNAFDCSIWACCLCDIAISPHTCTAFRYILSKHGVIVGISASFQSLLCSFFVLLLAEPCHNARLL